MFPNTKEWVLWPLRWPFLFSANTPHSFSFYSLFFAYFCANWMKGMYGWVARGRGKRDTTVFEKVKLPVGVRGGLGKGGNIVWQQWWVQGQMRWISMSSGWEVREGGIIFPFYAGLIERDFPLRSMGGWIIKKLKKIRIHFDHKNKMRVLTFVIAKSFVLKWS